MESSEFPELRLARSCALSLSSRPAYVLHFASQENAANGATEPLFAAAVSDSHEIKLYTMNTFCSRGSLHGHSKCISSIVFDKKDPKMLWSASFDGTLRLWDTSTSKGAVKLNRSYGLTAMDVNSDGSTLAVAVEKNSETLEVVIIFFDLNAGHPEAEFKDIHSDDVNQIKFHPANPKLLFTCSEDGLIAVLSISSLHEEDALLQTLNAEQSVIRIGLFGPSLEYLFSLTSAETLQLWQYSEGDQLASIANIGKAAPNSCSVDYVVDCMYHTFSRRLFLIAGSHSGGLHVLHVNLDVIESYQSLSGGHFGTVRCVLPRFDKSVLLTGAEDGMICAWMAVQNASPEVPIRATLKDKKSKFREGKKPYEGKAKKKDQLAS